MHTSDFQNLFIKISDSHIIKFNRLKSLQLIFTQLNKMEHEKSSTLILPPMKESTKKIISSESTPPK